MIKFIHFAICMLALSCSFSGLASHDTCYEGNPFSLETSSGLDTTGALFISNGKREIQISEGERIIVKTNNNRYSGKFKIENDSVISINSKSILLDEINMIAKSNAGKVFLLFLASIPIDAIGIISILDGHISKNMDHVWVGSIFLGAGTGGIITESILGKRYRRFKKIGRQDGTIKYNWTYSIRW